MKSLQAAKSFLTSDCSTSCLRNPGHGSSGCRSHADLAGHLGSRLCIGAGQEKIQGSFEPKCRLIVPSGQVSSSFVNRRSIALGLLGQFGSVLRDSSDGTEWHRKRGARRLRRLKVPSWNPINRNLLGLGSQFAM